MNNLKPTPQTILTAKYFAVREQSLIALRSPVKNGQTARIMPTLKLNVAETAKIIIRPNHASHTSHASHASHHSRHM